MPSQADFEAAFGRVKAILQSHAEQLAVQTDAPGHYYLNVPCPPGGKQPLFFGSVQIKKNYVSYHLLPLYVFPALLDDISPSLKKRMQGKACFNFKVVGEEVLAELANLTERGFQAFTAPGAYEAITSKKNHPLLERPDAPKPA